LKWDPRKSEWLKRARGVSFEEIVRSKLLAIEQHPARENQQIMVFEHRNYIWVVPCVEGADEFFLKTLYPSRKYAQRYGPGGKAL
jgi:hypothetical protein